MSMAEKSVRISPVLNCVCHDGRSPVLEGTKTGSFPRMRLKSASTVPMTLPPPIRLPPPAGLGPCHPDRNSRLCRSDAERVQMVWRSDKCSAKITKDRG
jgi:hypothetical protein